MLDASLFITDEIVERAVEMPDGSTHTLWFKQLPTSSFELHAIWANSKDERVASRAPARLLAMGLCNPDGKLALTPEQAERLKRPVLIKLIAALYEANGYGEQKEKPGNVSDSAATSGSGTS